MYLEKKNKNVALDPNEIGRYFKDIGLSLIVFLAIIGPTVKKAYFPSPIEPLEAKNASQ